MMKSFLVAFCGLLCASSTGEAGVVELRDRVTVTTASVVRLGDLAKIHDDDDRRAASLRELPLGPAPAAGRSWTVTYDDVRQKLQSRGENLAALEFRGQRQVVVTSASDTPEVAVKPAVVTQQSTPWIPPPTKAVLDAEQRRVETLLISVLKRSFRPAEPGTSVDFECQFDVKEAARLRNVRPEELHFVSGSLRSDAPSTMIAWWQDRRTGERQELAVTVAIVQRPQRLAVRHAVPKGFPLRPEDLIWVDAEIDDAGLALLGDVVGKETTRNLRAGHPLTMNDLASVPLMRTNDIVTVIVRRPGISVRREFKALSSAALHESVSLVALNDPRLRIQATVTGYREATISEVSVDAGVNEGVRFQTETGSSVPRSVSVR